MVKQLFLAVGFLLSVGGAHASLVSAVIGDYTTWRENGASTATFEGGVAFGTTFAFSLTSGAPPAVGDTVSFLAPSILLSGAQADQWSQMLGWANGACMTPTFAEEHCASAGLGVKEIGLDFSPIWAYDIRAGGFIADSGGLCYNDPNTGFCFPAEGVVNGVIAGARSFAPRSVYMTDGRWVSLEPLLMASAVPEPASLALAIIGLVGVVVGACRRGRA